MSTQNIAALIASELAVKPSQVSAAINLLDEGATVPFIARYRKEATQGLDDGHLRTLTQRLTYLRELNERRGVILKAINEQGKLSPELKQQLEAADSKTRLEDLYLPYKPKRRTKGQIAIEAGLEPLANKLFKDWHLDPEQAAQDYLNGAKGFADVDAVLDGVSSILSEQFAEDANLIGKLRNYLKKHAQLVSKVVRGKTNDAAKYRDYIDHSEQYAKVPSHRMLAMLRGRTESLLKLSLEVEASIGEQMLIDHYRLNLHNQAGAKFLTQVIAGAWKQKLLPMLETELIGNAKESAEIEAIKVFASNLKDLLMAAPAGPKVTLGIDPGLRTGCKLALIDNTGKLIETSTIFPHAPQNNWDKSKRTIANLINKYQIELIAIGNGTGSRETDKLAGEAIALAVENKNDKQKAVKVIVSEAGASVYSASELAANEFPALDVSLRGAVSIARRLQDPLAELVKIDPKAIGVGQYQHDVSQSQLSQSLDSVVEDCVNKIGVDLNSASVALLTHISGLNKTLAKNIVSYRDEHGRFNNRKELKKVTRLGPKAFEQAAGFLRINGGDNPLDASGVHPETYPLVEHIINHCQIAANDVLANEKLSSLNVTQLQSDIFGEITVNDVLNELKKPARDPRPEFKTAQFNDAVNSLNDLELNMVLEGVVSNVTNFGAFVDVGVHQDGLVHISALKDGFVSDPRDVVKAGDIVKVKVIEVDIDRKRVNLSMRLNDNAQAKNQQPTKTKNANAGKKPQHKTSKQGVKKGHKPAGNSMINSAFADAFANAKKK